MFRPIVAGPISPTHKINNFLHLIFTTIICDVTSYIKDSVDFLTILPSSISILSQLCTMDVVYLCSKIPHGLGLEAID